MTENRSLDDFFHAGDDADDADDADPSESPSGGSEREESEPDESPSAGEAPDEQTPDQPIATYRWSPSGLVCPSCGATVERQWRDGDAFVCADCKAW